MGIVADFRESKLFKAIADISVLHWFITIIPGLVSGIEATLHGKPLELVLLYFLGVSALALAAYHYARMLWGQYHPRITERLPRNLRQLLIPFLAVIGVLLFYFVRPKSTSTPASSITALPTPSAPPTGAATVLPAGQNGPPSGSNNPTTKHKSAKRTQNASVEKERQQDNSIHIGNGATVEQKSSGDCSPNQFGNNNSNVCAPLPPHLTFSPSYTKDLLNDGGQTIDVSINTDRPFPAARMSILFSGPVLAKDVKPPFLIPPYGQPRFRWDQASTHNHVEVPNAIVVVVDEPSALDQTETLMVQIKTRAGIKVVEVSPAD